MHFFEIDNQSLQTQIDQSVKFVLEQFQGRDDLLLSPENSITPPKGTDSRSKEQVLNELHVTKGGSQPQPKQNISDQESQLQMAGSLRNVNNNGTSFRQKLVQVLSGTPTGGAPAAGTTPMAQSGLLATNNASTSKPASAILGGLRTH